MLREVAWDRIGVWAGDGAEPAEGRPPRDVPCQCGRCLDATFVCLWCRRAVPWCLGSGANDTLDDLLCDDCWCERHEAAPADQAVGS